MIKRTQQFLSATDKFLPALLFAFLLSVQSLVAAGSADALLFPELAGPDGQTLAFSDICNTDDKEDGAAGHCGACSLSSAALPASNAPVLRVPETVDAPVRPAHYWIWLETPERWQYRRRGPPLT